MTCCNFAHGVLIDLVIRRERRDAHYSLTLQEESYGELLMHRRRIHSPARELRAAVAEERPLQVVGAINAYTARMAAAGRLQGLVSVRRRRRGQLPRHARSGHQQHGRCAHRHPAHHRCLRAAAAGGCRHRLGRGVQHRPHGQVLHQVRRRRSAHRGPGAVQALRPSSGQGNRVRSRRWWTAIKAAVDARTDRKFVIMARTDALAVEGMEKAIERAVACVEAGADMIFPEAMTELAMYRRFKDAVQGADPRQHHRIRPDAAVHAR